MAGKGKRRAARLTEARAREAIVAYFRWYASANGRKDGIDPANLKLRAKPYRWENRDDGWTFRLYYGGRPVWVWRMPGGRLHVRREEMPVGIFVEETLEPVE